MLRNSAKGKDDASAASGLNTRALRSILETASSIERSTPDYTNTPQRIQKAQDSVQEREVPQTEQGFAADVILRGVLEFLSQFSRDVARSVRIKWQLF